MCFSFFINKKQNKGESFVKKGKIIVVEGACDGIGKSTQYALLEKALIERGEEVVKHHFPSYDTHQGRAVEKYLAGEFGDIKQLSPYFINGIYAHDRAITWYESLKKEYEAGKTILLDRYTTSSLLYQASVIENVDERKKFVDYVCDFEYKKLGIKEPDMVVFLTAPFDLVTDMRKKRKNNDGLENDLHERDMEFMKNVYNNANFIAKYLNWVIIDCADKDEIKSIEEIQKVILEKVEKLL